MYVCGGVEVGINLLDCFVYYAFGRKKKSMNILNQKRYLFYITQFAASGHEDMCHCAVPQAFSCHPPLRKRERERGRVCCWALLYWPPGSNMMQMWKRSHPESCRCLMLQEENTQDMCCATDQSGYYFII